MQYILNEEEMNRHITDQAALQNILKWLPNKSALQEMCSKIADEWPTWTGWNNDELAEPWNCVLTVDYEHCCDKCPVQTICPNQYKSWSK